MATTTLDLLEHPYVFSQVGALSTSLLISVAKDRGLRLDAAILKRLHEQQLLSPLLEMTPTQVRAPSPPISEPTPAHSLVRQMRRAQELGQVLDPAIDRVPGRDRLPVEVMRFDSRNIDDERGWSNGLVYSSWQLLPVRWLRGWATRTPPPDPDPNAVPVPVSVPGSDLEEVERELAARQREVALALSVLDGRYLPDWEGVLRSLGPGGVQDWRAWRDAFDPAAVLGELGWDLERATGEAERLLLDAKNLDPMGEWGRLLARAPRSAWKSLRGDALAAQEARLAAEILLAFVEDLTGSPVLAPHGEVRLWHPLDDRLTAEQEPLDRTLSHLGIGPHPGVIVLVEGETERRVVPRLLAYLEPDVGENLVRIVAMNGADMDLTMVAVAMVAPVLSERRSDSYDLLRPPCRLLVTVDPDRRWQSPDHVERQRARLVSTIRDVVHVQGPDADTSYLDELVEVHCWSQSCFEFAHFSDEELLAAITAVHPDRAARPSDSNILSRLADVRARRLDIKHVWHDWALQPSKPQLADALWATLQAHIDDALAGHRDLPEAAEVVLSACETARSYARGRWSIPLAHDANPAEAT